MLTFLHTSPVHIATFNKLLQRLAPAIPVKHIVNEDLLIAAREAGRITPELSSKVSAIVKDTFDAGSTLLVCTCSTVGDGVERAGKSFAFPVIRIDRPMAEEAVRLGKNIIILATLPSTLLPTRQLILDVAHEANKNVAVIEVLCDKAWAKFEKGDLAGYLHLIAEKMEEVAEIGDVIVLAQASMAEAVTLCGRLPVPVVSSPTLGLEKAISLYQALP